MKKYRTATRSPEGRFVVAARRCASSGFSLIVTLVIAAAASVLVGGVLYYTSTQTSLTRRIVQYDASATAAVTATEKIVANMTQDFQSGGATTVANNVATYTSIIPKPEDLTLVLTRLSNSGPGNNNNTLSTKADWKKFDFKDTSGQINRTDIQKVSDWTFRDLNCKYPGLRGYAATYRIISNTSQKDRSVHITSGVRQDIEIASIPLCQFQYFYVPDMELHPLSTGMRFNGRIHCNGSIYSQPGVEVIFQNHVTSSRKIVNSKLPADPVVRSPVKLTYRAERETGLNTLNIPIGTNAGPDQLSELILPPGPTEDPASLLAQERFYNKADLIVVVSNSVITAHSGSYNAGSVIVPWLDTRGIVTRATQVFYDSRECTDMAATEIDVSKLISNYSSFTSLLGRPLKTIWILDLGSEASNGKKNNNGKGNGAKKKANGITGDGVVRLRNASSLPAAGLSVISPNPIYILGDYNTVTPAPALVAGDAVTVLSANWADGTPPKVLSSRVAVNTTVNAAIITGMVPTGNGAYSGGAENAIRLLEDWTGKTLTFNGSIAVLYYSLMADSAWGGPDVYKPPTRNFAYDTKLADLATTPPGMPNARTVFRSDWTLIKPNSKL